MGGEELQGVCKFWSSLQLIDMVLREQQLWEVLFLQPRKSKNVPPACLISGNADAVAVEAWQTMKLMICYFWFIKKILATV